MKSKNNTAQNSKKRIAFQVRLFSDTPSDESELPTEIQVIPTGEWDHPIWGSMKIDADTIAEFVENFNKVIRKAKVPITAGHSVMEELPAIGWFTELFDRGDNGLYATVEWTSKGKELLLEGAYKYFSPEYYTVYEDPATHRKYKNVLVGGALTNHPFFKELDDVVAFSEPQFINQFSESIMTIEEILAKAAGERTEDEVAFLEENKDDFTDEQTEQLEGETGADDGDDSDKGDDDDDGADEGKGDDDEGGDDKKEASAPKGKLVTMSAAAVAALEEKANLGATAFSELDKMKVATSVEKMTFSSTNAKGHFTPKQSEAVEKFMFSLDETQRAQFTNIVNNMPEMKMSEEIGDGGTEEVKASDLLDKKADELVTASVKAGEKMTYSEAVKQVLRDNPELNETDND